MCFRTEYFVSIFKVVGEVGISTLVETTTKWFFKLRNCKTLSRYKVDAFLKINPKFISKSTPPWSGEIMAENQEKIELWSYLPWSSFDENTSLFMMQQLT